MDTNKEEFEPMNIKIALNLLDIPDNNLTNLSQEYIKRKYHKMALKWHPDKNGNTVEATAQFQKVNQAYTYLLNELTKSNTDNTYNSNIFADFVSSFDFKDEKNMYKSLLSVFLSNILKTESNVMKDLMTKIIKDIVLNGAKVISLKLIEDLDKDKSIELLNFLYKYKNILYIDNETLELVSSLIKEKYKNDSVYVLNPSIDDLFENNIYKLYINGRLFLVPLWHNEMYFDDTLGNDIIVLCKPELPENVTMDDNNNVYYNLLVPFDKNMVLNQPQINEELIVIIGKREFKIPLFKLYIKQEQLYVFKGKGISKIIEDDVYNVSCKGDVIIKIVFV
jgi:curved DNA-binding protein CbpA